jgi:uncharacterized protein (DUF3084 family)
MINMNDELKDGLKSVIAEALQPIQEELRQLNNRVGNIETELTGIKSELVPVKSELTGVKTELANVKTQLDENTQMTRAIYDRQEETDARLENMSMDFNKMHGDVTAIKEQLTDVQSEVEFTYQKSSKNEMELFKLKRDYN